MTKRYPEKIKHLHIGFRVLIKTLVRRIDSGKNCLVICIGQTGGGKSLAMVSLMYWIHLYMYGEEPSLEEMKRHWVFKATEFLKNMNNPDLNKKEVWLWDETGAEMSHKTHASIQNRAIGWLVQSFRNLQQIVFFTVPTASFIDASVRKLLHYQIEVKKVIKTKNVCVTKVIELDYNARMDKTYYHRLTTRSGNGDDGYYMLDFIPIPRPPKFLEDEYEKMAAEFKRSLNEKIQKMVEYSESKEEDKYKVYDYRVRNKKPLTERQEIFLECLKKGITKVKEIGAIAKCDPAVVSQNFGFMRNKGINVDKYLRKEGFKTKKSIITAGPT